MTKNMLQSLKLFPAWAGVIPYTPEKTINYETFPRMGGGDPSDAAQKYFPHFFSPHGRG